MYEDRWLSSRARVIEVDYGKVETGKTVVKRIEIWNECSKEQVYEVQRDPITNPLDHVFQLRSYTWTLTPQEKFFCEIRYRPFVAFATNVDYFRIVDSSGGCLQVLVRGTSIGPTVTSSSAKVVFYTNENHEIKKRIKLTNNSNMMATFMFDIDQNYRPFKLDTTHGVINPHSHKYIMIMFVPSENGRYTCHLPCLILHQELILIELFGYCGSLYTKRDNINSFNYPWKMKTGFEGYMSDNVSTTENLPPVSLSKNYFDFGQADVDPENVIQRIPQAVCLTNHSQRNLLVVWEQDINGVFDVKPSTIQLGAQQTALFEISFNPDIKGNLFTREVIGSIFAENTDCKKEEIFDFPFITSLRTIGHSFPVSSNGWIPQYEMPKIVIMPPCVPPLPVYTTFLIKKFGHLPLTFHFVPPPASRFILKPMLGIIHQDYQIMTLELIPKLKNEQIYVERWTIYFNGNRKNENYIDFKGYAEYANVTFNNKNVVTFAPTYPQCQQFEKVLMRNVTRHTIKYQFRQVPSQLTVTKSSGEILSNDILTEEWSLCPDKNNVDYDFDVQCILFVTKNGSCIGPEVCINIRVRGRSETGVLMAIPSELTFAEQEYNVTKTLSFHVFNISSVNIYYKIVCQHRNWPIGNLEKDVEIRPASETIFPGAHGRIIVSVTPRTPGYYEFIIQYFVRANYLTDALISKQVARNICYVNCMCVLPTLKIKSLCSYGSNFNTSSTFLWNSMRINDNAIVIQDRIAINVSFNPQKANHDHKTVFDVKPYSILSSRLNTILKNILPGEKRTININYVPMIVNEGFIVIKLSLMNPTSVNVSWTLTRIHRCSCKPVVKKKGLSFQRVELECVHKELCVVHPMSGVLKPKEITMVTITLRYTLVGQSEITWDLDIQHDRHIFLKMLVECLSTSEKKLNFLHGKHLNFGEVYIGNKDAIYMTHWIHNATKYNLPYSININPLRKLNMETCCEVFSCITQCGTVEALSSKPILVKFHPRMFGMYKVVLPVTLNDSETELILQGESSCNPKLKIINKATPDQSSCKMEEFPVYFNQDCIYVESIATHDRVIKMLLVHNNTKHDSFAYEWKSCEIPEIVRVEIHPCKGIMQPNAVQSFRVEICGRGYPCKIDLNIPCEFLNASERRSYQRSVLKHDILSRELEGQFTITEKGTSVPKPWIKIHKKPQAIWKHLTVRCCIRGSEDESLKVSLVEELKSTPSQTIAVDINEKRNSVKEGKELSIALFILEGLLWEITNSRKFRNVIEETLVTKTNLYYSQFAMNLMERRKAIKRSYTSPSKTLLASIFEKILFIIVHEEFSLETAHLISDEDVRHVNYLKILSKKKRASIQQENQELQKKDVLPYNKLRSRSSVSFTE